MNTEVLVALIGMAAYRMGANRNRSRSKRQRIKAEKIRNLSIG